MNVLEIYFRTEKTIEELAASISSILGAVSPQEREGVNRGGKYFQMEVFGLTFELLENAGEIYIPERSGWSYYALMYSVAPPLEMSTLTILADYAAALFNFRGLECEVDSLS